MPLVKSLLTAIVRAERRRARPPCGGASRTSSRRPGSSSLHRARSRSTRSRACSTSCCPPMRVRRSTRSARCSTISASPGFASGQTLQRRAARGGDDIWIEIRRHRAPSCIVPASRCRPPVEVAAPAFPAAVTSATGACPRRTESWHSNLSPTFRTVPRFPHNRSPNRNRVASGNCTICSQNRNLNRSNWKRTLDTATLDPGRRPRDLVRHQRLLRCLGDRASCALLSSRPHRRARGATRARSPGTPSCFRFRAIRCAAISQGASPPLHETGIDRLLRIAAARGASTLYLDVPGAPVHPRRRGDQRHRGRERR